MRNQKIKFGDFGISIVTQSTLQTYSLKGLTPQWCLPQIKADYLKAQQTGTFSSFYKRHLTKEVLL